MVRIGGTPKTRNPFLIKVLSVFSVAWKWHFLNHAPTGTMAFAGFMRKVGVVKAAAADWKDLFFPIAHALPGN